MASWRYCGKEDTRVEGPVEYGVPPASKAVKGDTKERNHMILTKGLKWAIDEGYVAIEKYSQLRKSVDLFKVDCLEPMKTADHCRGLWLHGPPGTGKSRHARTLETDVDQLYLKSMNKWFDGYTGQRTILLDDLDMQGACLGHHLKIWTDRYHCTGETKGGTVPLHHAKFIVTSNYLPENLWGSDQTLVDAIRRRFKFEDFSRLAIE